MMSKRAISIPVAVILSLLLFGGNRVSAADITVGASTWYTSWDIELEDSTGTITTDRGCMYGPVFSVSFLERWSVAGLFLYGKFKNPEWDGSPAGIPALDRYDFDMTINYSLNSIFKLFVGGKYVKFDFDKADYVMYGPGGGLSATFNIWDSLYLIANLSYVYLWGETKLDSTPADLKTRGINSSMALAYYIVPASTTLQIGGRYQRLYEDREVQDSLKYHEMLGVTASAMYSFSL